MPLHLIIGTDRSVVRTATTSAFAGRRPDRIDLADDGYPVLIQALNAPSLFAPTRDLLVVNIDQLSDSQAAEVMDCVGDNTVVGTASNLRPKLRRALGDATFVEARAPRDARGRRRRVLEIAKDHGVSLRGLEGALADRVEDMARVDGICWQLAAAGISSPSRAQIDLLTASAGISATPWEVLDLLSAGDLAGAQRRAAGLEPLAVLGYLASQLMVAGRCQERNLRSPSEAANSLGITEFQARRAVSLAERLRRTPEALCYVVRASTDAKRGDGHAVLARTLSDLGHLWA